MKLGRTFLPKKVLLGAVVLLPGLEPSRVWAEPPEPPSSQPPGEEDPSPEATSAPPEVPQPAEQAAEPASQHRILLLAARQTPASLRQQLETLVQQVGTVVDDAPVHRAAREHGYPPTSAALLERVLPELSVALVVVVEPVHALRPQRERRRGRRRFSQRLSRSAHAVRLVYREGGMGLWLLEEEHPLRQGKLDPIHRERVLAELRLTLALVTRPKGAPSLDELLEALRQQRRSPPAEPGARVYLGLRFGLGVGHRELRLPTSRGQVRLQTGPFPAALLGLSGWYEPVARGPWRYGLVLRYGTSLVLRTAERDVEGVVRRTGSRAQRFQGEALLGWRPTTGWLLSLGVGYLLRLFGSDLPLSVPDYVVGGPGLSIGAETRLAANRLAVALQGHFHWTLTLSEALHSLGARGGPIVGAELQARYEFGSLWALGLSLRESDALLSTAGFGDAQEAERSALLWVEYAP